MKIADKKEVRINNLKSGITFEKTGGGDWKVWDRFISVDKQKVYYIGNVCDTCKFFFTRQSESTVLSINQENLINSLNEGSFDFVKENLRNLGEVIPNGNYLVLKTTIKPESVNKDSQNDYFKSEQKETWREYDNEEAFYNDGSFTYSHDNKLKGAIILFSDNGIPHYEYAPLYITKNDYDKWVEYILDKNSHCEWVQNQFWKLDEYSNILVLRNKLWFTNAVSHIESIWNIILHERCNGFEHRAPKKRNYIHNKNNLLSKCLINIEKL